LLKTCTHNNQPTIIRQTPLSPTRRRSKTLQNHTQQPSPKRPTLFLINLANPHQDRATMAHPTQNPTLPLAQPGPPNPSIKAPNAAAFESFHPIRRTQRTKLKTKRATLLTAVANSETRIAALKQNGTEPTLSRAARKSALSRAHLDRVRAQSKLQRLLRKNRE
jgi:hypothetical protein